MAGAQGVVITTNVPVTGRFAVPCYVDESLPMLGPAQAVQVVTSGPMAGGPPMAVRLAPAGTPAVGPCLPIYIVSGVLDVMAYTNKVKAIAPANLIGYWPLAESSGTVINDVSGNGRNGTYTGVTLGQQGIGDGRTSASFDGTTSKGDVMGAGLAAAFVGAEGSFGAWIKVSAVGVWSDATIRRFGVVQVDANNRVLLQKNSTANQLIPNYIAGGTAKSATITTSSTDWLHVMTVWSKGGDTVQHYLNGAQQGATLNGLGVWVGVPVIMLLGAADTTPANVWSGLMAHAALWNTPLSAAQVLQNATVAS